VKVSFLKEMQGARVPEAANKKKISIGDESFIATVERAFVPLAVRLGQ
jgi:hypothetical protein